MIDQEDELNNKGSVSTITTLKDRLNADGEPFLRKQKTHESFNNLLSDSSIDKLDDNKNNENSNQEAEQQLPLTIKQLESTWLSEWFSWRVRFSLESVLSLKDLYQDYYNFMINDIERVPVSKRIFSSQLKKHLNSEINTVRVKFYTKSGIYIQGLVIISTGMPYENTDVQPQ